LAFVFELSLFKGTPQRPKAEDQRPTIQRPWNKLLFSFDLIDWQAFPLPLVEATQQCCHVRDVFRFEVDHRTGGRMFVWSRTVRDNELVFWQLIHMIQNFCGWN
jgi:hypothetical protein